MGFLDNLIREATEGAAGHFQGKRLGEEQARNRRIEDEELERQANLDAIQQLFTQEQTTASKATRDRLGREEVQEEADRKTTRLATEAQRELLNDALGQFELSDEVRAALGSDVGEGFQFIREHTKRPSAVTPTGPERQNAVLIDAIKSRAAEMGRELTPSQAVMLSLNQGQLQDFFATIPVAELKLRQARVDSARERFEDLDNAVSRLEMTPVEAVKAKNRFLVEIGLQRPGQVLGVGLAALGEEEKTLFAAAGGRGRPTRVVNDPDLPAPGTRTPLDEGPLQRAGSAADTSEMEGLAEAIRAHPAANQEFLGQVDTILSLDDADATPQARAEALELILAKLEGT